MNPFKNQVDLKNSTSRNAFDLSKRVLFSAKPGELLPVYHKTMMPGDNFSINLKHFSRTLPIVSAPFTSVKEYYDFFFVPYKLLWSQADQAFTSNSNNSQIASSPTAQAQVSSKVPYISLNRLYRDNDNILKILSEKKNYFGFNRAYVAQKLLNMLGYPYIDNTMLKGIIDGTKFPSGSYTSQVSALPLLAYHKIYYDFYSNSRWENSRSYLFNADYATQGAVYFPALKSDLYYNSDTLFDLHYSDYARDLVQSLLPSRQLGDVSTFSSSDNNGSLSVDGSGTVTVKFNGKDRIQLSTGGFLSRDMADFASDMNREGSAIVANGDSSIQGNVNLTDLISRLKSEVTTTTSVLDLRNAMFVQRYREILGTGKLDFKSIVSKLYGFDGVPEYTDTVKYLGGNSGFINMETQVNNNFTSDQGQADLRSIGTGNIQETIDFTAPSFGLIMCIYHAVPQVDYLRSGMDFDINKVSIDDYANPVFDKLGLQGVNIQNFSMAYVNDLIFAYNLRYYDYKSDINDVKGIFRESNEYKSYIAPVDLDKINGYVVGEPGSQHLEINYNFFKCDPRVLNTIFAVNANENTNTDTFICSAEFNINAVRNLDSYGFPY